MKKEVCYCGNPKPYPDCCGPFLSGKSRPKSPEELMRSRYSAFCIKDVEYLISTCHPTGRRPDDRENLLETARKIQWQGLKVIKTGIHDQETGYVEFAAFYKGPEPGQLHERSSFIREKGIWYYLAGQLLAPLKFQRNDPCWCGSGAKFKKCHGKLP